jgi:hypothetical protein
VSYTYTGMPGVQDQSTRRGVCTPATHVVVSYTTGGRVIHGSTHLLVLSCSDIGRPQIHACVNARRQGYLGVVRAQVAAATAPMPSLCGWRCNVALLCALTPSVRPTTTRSSRTSKPPASAVDVRIQCLGLGSRRTRARSRQHLDGMRPAQYTRKRSTIGP